jgi:branched-chain amino acid transport system permease protein
MSEIFNLQQLVNGITLGSIYALISLGYTMVYGIIRTINFAHGDFYMVGAYAAYFSITFFASRKWPVPAIFIFLISFAAGSLVAMSANYIAYKPLRYKPRLSALITAIGVSLFLEYFFSALPQIGPSYRAFPTSTFIAEKVFVFKNLRISSYVIIDVVVAAILMAFITYLIKYTKIGMAMRAASQDKDAAKLMGIDLEKVITITFLIGGGFAGIAGVLTGITYPRIGPYMGILPGLKAFIAAVLGGIGNVPGAMIGSYIMGISETFATAYKSLFGDGIAFLILIIVLLFRPQGLLGETTAEKV